MHLEHKTGTPSALPATPGGEGDGSDEIARLEVEIDHAEGQMKRALADLDNYRKRFERELERLRDQERAAILRDLLPVADNLERALSSASGSAEAFRVGVEAVSRQLTGVLKRYEVEPFDDVGKPFDPDWHDVVATQPSDAADGTILAVVERGYRIGDRPLRHARVVAARG